MVIANSGCKDTHCPAFPPHLVDYYPYRIGDVLKFSNPENDTMSLKINFVETSDKFSFGWNCKCSCEFAHSFQTEIDPLTPPGWMYLEGRIYGSEDDRMSIMCHINDSHIGDHLYLDKKNINPHVPESSHIFGDTLSMEDVKARRFNKVVIVKGEGIIEFYDLEGNYIWKKVKK